MREWTYTTHQGDISSDNSDKGGIIRTNMIWQLGQAWSETGSYIGELLGFGKYLSQLLLKFFVYKFMICLCRFWWMYMYIDRQYNYMPWLSKKAKLLYSNVFLVNRGLSYLYKETSWYDDLEDLKTLKNTVGSATWHSDIPSCGSSLLITAITIVPWSPLNAGVINTSTKAIGSIYTPIISPIRLPVPTIGGGATTERVGWWDNL